MYNILKIPCAITKYVYLLTDDHLLTLKIFCMKKSLKHMKMMVLILKNIILIILFKILRLLAGPLPEVTLSR